MERQVELVPLTGRHRNNSESDEFPHDHSQDGDSEDADLRQSSLLPGREHDPPTATGDSGARNHLTRCCGSSSPSNLPGSASLIGGAGLACCMFVVGFTTWLSWKVVFCPDWAVECSVSERVRWMKNNIGLVQGLATSIYSIGLIALAYWACIFSEAAIWPLLSKQPFEIQEVDAYLGATRGASTVSLLNAISAIRTWDTGIVLVCSAMIILIPHLAAPLVGFVYAQQNLSAKYASSYQLAGGIGRIYAQTNPLTSTAIDGATLSWFVSWAQGAAEPMPDYRDWYVDREALATRGSMTINAVRVKKTVRCSAHSLEQIEAGHDKPLKFATKMASHNGYRFRNSSDHVVVRAFPTMAVWAEDFVFLHENRTRATVVFAAINGNISGGYNMTLRSVVGNMTYATSIACDVDVELVDDTLRVGDGDGIVASQTLSSVADIHIGHQNSSTDSSQNTKNEVALWFAVAPVLCGVSVEGKQPMFFKNHRDGGLPVPYTSTNYDEVNDWTIPEIENFIDVAVGAFGLSTSVSWPQGREKVRMTSRINVRKLNPSKPGLLVSLPVSILSLGLFLKYWNNFLHRHFPMPMRRARLAELLESSRTLRLHEDADAEGESADVGPMLEIGELGVRFETRGEVGLVRVPQFTAMRRRRWRVVMKWWKRTTLYRIINGNWSG